jgi:two-component system KDP operon response regulator KdpE
VTLAAPEIHVTPIEYRLLITLIKHAGMVNTQRQLLTQVWGPAYGEQAQYLRVYMGQFRGKFEAVPIRPRYLLPEQGVGYRLGGE